MEVDKYNLLDKLTINLVPDAETYLIELKESSDKQAHQRLEALMGENPLDAFAPAANESN